MKSIKTFGGHMKFDSNDNDNRQKKSFLVIIGSYTNFRKNLTWHKRDRIGTINFETTKCLRQQFFKLFLFNPIYTVWPIPIYVIDTRDPLKDSSIYQITKHYLDYYDTYFFSITSFLTKRKTRHKQKLICSCLTWN